MSTKSDGYLVVIEKARRNYSAYVPDLPGCVATGRTRQAARQAIAAPIRMHVAGLREDCLPVPDPSTSAELLPVA